MTGFTAVDGITNKSIPVGGTASSGVGVSNGAIYTVPAPVAQDPVGKMRVSTPQALIDTDFEYGQQPTKWESISLQNNRQSVYYIPQSPLVITSITGSGTTMTIAGTFTVAANTPIYIQNAGDPNANGWWWTVAGGTNTMTVITASAVSATNCYNAALTYGYTGYFYSGCGILLGSTSAFTYVGTTITCTTSSAHGLSLGSLIYVRSTTSSAGGAINGAWVVTSVPTNNTFTFTVPTAPTGTLTNTADNLTLYARPAGYTESRSFDGGVAFSAGSAAPNSQLIRQTRRYFRYQSGKGIQFSTGTSLKPALFVTSVTASGATVTVNTRFAHNMAAGATIIVANCTQPEYNGTWTIASVPTPTSLTYTANYAPSVSPATGFPIRVSPNTWYGSSNRIGFYDTQNGLFFEYDGQTLYAVWRQSVNQISGLATVTNGSGAITGTGTAFSSELKPGDFIVIRGQSYRVANITSDTAMIITPEYRGTTINATGSGVVISKTVDTRIPQSQWTDKLDGTGPSGFTLDLTRMQMFYIDYSWYGAGFARWGLRTGKGQVTYVYQQTNNNVQYEAYMRSGNMASRYESNGTSPSTYITASLGTGGAGTVINVASTAGFAPTGTLRISAASGTGAVEYISYTLTSATSFTVVSRAQTGGAAAATSFTYSATAPVAVEFTSPDTNASLSHWGSSVIMDGQFNDDKSLVFNYGTTTAVSTSSTTPVVLLALRIAPSVDNGITGLLGAKEIINRMQLQLESLGIVTTGNTYLINLVLNGYASGAMSGSFQTPIQQANGISSSLAQIATNNNAVNVVGGESVAAAYCGANGVSTLDLGNVRDLGNSILGGGTSLTVPTSQSGFYPDGPDILYVVATAVSATAGTILARLSWKEAQA
jgi:hypothetical protein